jgi:hypothetical protein
MRSMTTILGIPCALALLVTLGITPAWAQESGEQADRAHASSSPQDGIKVHGDWTITLRNPDGSVAAVHEFKNALAVGLGGDKILAQLIGGAAVAGQFTVNLFTTPVTACNSSNAPCQITEASSLNSANSRDLTKSVPLTGPDAGKLILRGSVRVPANATISVVQTDLTQCLATVSPTACVSASGVGFTQRSLATPIAVVQDQLVEVRVVISFS